MVTIEHAFLIPAEIDKVFTYLANPPMMQVGNCRKHSELLDSTRVWVVSTKSVLALLVVKCPLKVKLHIWYRTNCMRLK